MDLRKEILEEIINGIQVEMEDSPDSYAYQVKECIKDGAIWTVIAEPAPGNRLGVDESLEESAAWWPEPVKGAADVLAVIPELQMIHLRHATTTPPGPGQTLFLYPPRYLDALLKTWERGEWANSALERYDALDSGRNHPKGNPLTVPLPWLRKSQKEAFKLPCHDFGYLWGPPGTGKTTTLGILVAAYLMENPTARVLLFSTTNVAVDLAIVSVDRALEEISKNDQRAVSIRKQCFRIGNYFNAKHYEGRGHLIPVTKTSLIAELTRLEAERPDKQNAEAFAAWKEAIESLRARIRRESLDVLNNARLSAMTTTRAVFTLDDLVARSPYDLIVFDEASQVSRAHALALLPLGKCVIFAGDPKQLSPIVQSGHKDAKEWLGKSPFIYMRKGHSSTVFLDEQSRMVQPICDIVSRVFYDGKLKLAEDAKKDPKFLKDRTAHPVAHFGNRNACLHDATSEGTYSQKYGGPIRYDTAQEIASWVSDMVSFMNDKDILVLTPFRAQRTIIRQALNRAGAKYVAVSTVHKAQGSERHTIIFDPTLGDSPFLKTDEAMRLINVAISRAKARLILVVSPGDRKNPLLSQIAKLIEGSGKPKTGFIPVSVFAQYSDFPENMLGKKVQNGDAYGEVVDVLEGGEKYVIYDTNTGKRRTFLTSAMKKPNKPKEPVKPH